MGIHRVGFGSSADVRVPSVRLDGDWSGRTVATAAHGLDAAAIVSVAPDTPCRDAEARARERRVRHVFVVDGERLVGVLCRCDLYPEPEPHEDVAQRMARDVFALQPSSTLAEAAAAMRALAVGCLPVVERERPVGVVTRGDLRRAGIPEQLLGAHECMECGSVHGVRTDGHAGIEYCLDCIDLFSALGNDYGEGD